MMQDRPQETFAVIIEEIKQTAKGPQVAMKIPAFDSSYPILIDVTADVSTMMVVGDAVNVVLERQNLKKAKTGTYDGTKHWHFYWGWVRYASATEGVKAQATATVAVASEDRREVSIRRAVALKAAVDFMPSSGWKTIVTQMVLEVADEFDAWLSAGITNDTPPVPQTEAPDPKPMDGAVTDAVTFWEATIAHYGKDRAEVQAIVLPMFDNDLGGWIKAGNSWAEAFEKVKGA